MTVTRFCHSCGAPLTPGYRFCGACGQPIAANGGGMPSSPMTAPPRVRATPARSNLVVVLLALLLILVVGGEAIWIFLWQNSQTATETVATPSSPYPSARTGDITTGPAVAAASQTIASSGGTIVVDRPGDPLDGFVIDVPANSYADSRTFSVSYAPVTQQTFGSDIHPISPMITVDNGGGYSDELMYIRVPVQVPEGSFAMGFLYDEQSKQLEGMPLVGRDADSITVATRHFSDFFISMIDEALLEKNIDSGFQPGIDDWQFDNVCSYIAPGGHCEGQSIAAMWYYYTKPDGGKVHLYDRYDNNGNPPATPNLWQDDSFAYRFCSTIHQDYGEYGTGAEAKWDALAGIGWKLDENNKWKSFVIPGIGDASTWRLFAYSIQASSQPQLVCIASNAGGGHALICYAVSDNGTLRIADPNKHGQDDRIIEFVDNQFKPYTLDGKAYEKIIYQGAWTIVPYDTIAGRWTEFENGRIGNDRFPVYKIVYEDEEGQLQELTDGTTFAVNKVRFYTDYNDVIVGLNIFRDGVELQWDASGKFELSPGNNLLGIYITKKVGIKSKYVDFKYINVLYSNLAIDPASLDGEPNTQYTFTAKADSPPAGARYDWYVDGSISQSDSSTTFTSVFPSEGNHKVSVKLVDSAGKEIAVAQADVAISASTTSGLQQLQQMNLFGASFYCDQFLYNRWTQTQAVSPYGFSDTHSIPENGDWMVITWNGTSFSGEKVNNPVTGWSGGTNEVKGTVSSDGKTLLSLEYNYSGTNDYDQRKIVASYKWQNIPIDTQINENPQSYIVKMEHSTTYYVAGEKVTEITLQSPPIKEFTLMNLQCYFMRN